MKIEIVLLLLTIDFAFTLIDIIRIKKALKILEQNQELIKDFVNELAKKYELR